MKRKILSLAGVATAVILSAPATAHEVWVDINNATLNKPLVANLAYGHYPLYSAIPEKRINFFDPLKLHTSDGKVVDLILNKDANYIYHSQQPLTHGTYIVSGHYKPQFWTKDANDKWFHNQDLAQVPNAVHCEVAEMFAKEVVNVGHSKNRNFATQAIGQTLEFVLTTNPSDIKLLDLNPIQLLFKGEPLKGAEVVGSYAGFDKSLTDPESHKDGAKAYYSKTNKDGIIDFIPSAKGKWMLKVIHKADYEGDRKCGQANYYSTISFNVD